MFNAVLRYSFATMALLAPGMAVAQQADSLDHDPAAYSKKIEAILPDTPSFTDWVKKTGAEAPDFSKLPKENMLPDPMKFMDGRTVRTQEDWKARRAEIEQLSEKYVWGTIPPRPHLDRAEVLDEKHGDGYIIRNLRFVFGPEGKGSMRARVYIPDGAGPFPVLINDNLQGWSAALLKRRYISAGYAGNDAMDDADAIAQLYPEYSFALLPRRAWAASLVVDYLESLPQVDKQRIAIWGASRGGKMISIAAVLDQRIAAVIAVSTGVGGVLPWRDSGEVGLGEGIEQTTRRFPTWFLPSLRFFTGREDRLPVDGNLVAAMIAPRPLLMEWGHNDQVANTWGDEQTYYSVLPVYNLFGVPDRVNTMTVPGFHGANDEEACLDWLDIQFGRSNRAWHNDLIFQWNWKQWRDATHQSVDLSAFPDHGRSRAAEEDVSSVEQWEHNAGAIRKSVRWMLGDTPPILAVSDFEPRRRIARPAAPGGGEPGRVTPDLPGWVIASGGNSFGWLAPEKDQTVSKPISFGTDGLSGDLYYPKGTAPGTKLPTVIWLHGYSYQLGYMWDYHEDLHPILALVKAGYAVMAYDQSGFGSRMSETQSFYSRYPGWSHMGMMVHDVSLVIDALQKDDLVDPHKIYVFGYSMGGQVGLYAAALDQRIGGVVSVAGFTPMRTDTAATGTGGVARYSDVRDFLPRLGFFIGHEGQIPYDFNDVLALIAPRPVMIVQPLLDREASPADVSESVEQAKKIYALYHADQNLQLREPWDFNRLTTSQETEIAHWMNTNLR